MKTSEIVFILVVFLSNAIHSVTGFAGTLLAMPASIRLIGVEQAKTVLNSVGLLCCIILGFQTCHDANKKEFVKISLWMLAGMVLGLALFQWIPFGFLSYVYAVLIIAVALKNLFIQREFKLSEIQMTLILLTAGIIHGMFISGGALLVIYARRRFPDKKEFRATLTPVWIFLNSLLLIRQIWSGSFTSHVVFLSVVSTVPMLLGVAVGNLIYKKINQKAFSVMACILLLISGIMMLI